MPCYTCPRNLGHQKAEYRCNLRFVNLLACCNGCCTIKLTSEFSKDMQDKWGNMSLSSHINFKICTVEQSATGRHAVDNTVPYTCAGARCSP